MTFYKVYQFMLGTEYWTRYFVDYDRALNYKRELIADYMSAVAETLAEKAKTQEVNFQEECQKKLEGMDFAIEEIEVEE